MRDFTWHIFRETGNIEAYLLYKEMRELDGSGLPDESLQGAGETVAGAENGEGGLI